jgi:AcrR family transcriptional regulator
LAEGGRVNQRLRTRKDLLQAAAQLLKQGRTPTLEEVAETALVSRATAYRYFPGTDALLAEAALDVVVPDIDDIFDDRPSDDPTERLCQLDAALQKMIVENDVALRMMLAHSLEQSAKGGTRNSELPVRQNRRTPLIEAALEPAEKQFTRTNLETLKSALALIVGTEGMMVFRDVLQMGDEDAQRVKCWAIKALVEAAKKE